VFGNLDGQRHKRTVEFDRVMWRLRTIGGRSLRGGCVRLGRVTTILVRAYLIRSPIWL
jgi:hypothetical protein